MQEDKQSACKIYVIYVNNMHSSLLLLKDMFYETHDKEGAN